MSRKSRGLEEKKRVKKKKRKRLCAREQRRDVGRDKDRQD